MIFHETPLPGAFLVELEPLADERGFFARSFCAAQFAARGLAAHMSQCSISYNARRATLRGMHYQAAPHEEHKLVRCTAGAIFDVLVDLRPGSRALHRWHGEELSAANHRALYVPPGVAHGFVTLADDCEVLYMISEPFAPQSARGVRWDDPAFGIRWPLRPEVISARDAQFALLPGSAPGT